MTPLPTPPTSPMPPSKARPTTSTAGRQQFRKGGQAQVQSTKQQGPSEDFAAAAAAASSNVGLPKTAAPRQRLWGIKATGANSSAPPSFPAKIVLNDRAKTHLRRPRLGERESTIAEKARFHFLGKKLDLRCVCRLHYVHGMLTIIRPFI